MESVPAANVTSGYNMENVPMGPAVHLCTIQHARAQLARGDPGATHVLLRPADQRQATADETEGQTAPGPEEAEFGHDPLDRQLPPETKPFLPGTPHQPAKFANSFGTIKHASLETAANLDMLRILHYPYGTTDGTSTLTIKFKARLPRGNHEAEVHRLMP